MRLICRLGFRSTAFQSTRTAANTRTFSITASVRLSSTSFTKDKQDSDAKSTARKAQSYERILLSTDYDRLYSLIRAYIAEPQLAETVKEAVIPEIRPESPGLEYDFTGSSYSQAHTATNLDHGDATHASIERHVKLLGLEHDNTQRILRSLRWYRQHFFESAYNGNVFVAPDKSHEFTLGTAVILLSLCKNIERLSLGQISNRIGMDNPLKDYLLKSNYRKIQNPGLQKLKAVEVFTTGMSNCREDGMDEVEFLEYFQFVHRLPFVESFAMDGVHEHQPWREYFPARCSNIRNIHIKHSDISAQLFSTILATSKCLEEVTLSRGGLRTRDSGINIFIMSTLGKALLEYRSTLRKLDIDSEAYRGEEESLEDRYGSDPEELEQGLRWTRENQEKWHGKEYMTIDEHSSASSSLHHPDSREYGITIGSLHDFKALTHLSISIRAVLGEPESKRRNSRGKILGRPFKLVDRLPPSLEYLRLYDYTKGTHQDFDDQVQQLLAEKEQRFPKLKVIDGIYQTVPGMLAKYPGATGWDDDKVYQRPERSDLGWKEA